MGLPVRDLFFLLKRVCILYEINMLAHALIWQKTVFLQLLYLIGPVYHNLAFGFSSSTFSYLWETLKCNKGKNQDVLA